MRDFVEGEKAKKEKRKGKTVSRVKK